MALQLLLYELKRYPLAVQAGSVVRQVLIAAFTLLPTLHAPGVMELVSLPAGVRLPRTIASGIEPQTPEKSQVPPAPEQAASLWQEAPPTVHTPEGLKAAGGATQ